MQARGQELRGKPGYGELELLAELQSTGEVCCHQHWVGYRFLDIYLPKRNVAMERLKRRVYELLNSCLLYWARCICLL